MLRQRPASGIGSAARECRARPIVAHAKWSSSARPSAYPRRKAQQAAGTNLSWRKAGDVAWHGILSPMCSAAEVQGETSSAESTTGFAYETSVSSGRLEIRPVEAADVTAACVVMTRAFATTDEDISLSSATAYVSNLRTQADKGVLLVARLFPTDPSLLPPNQTSRIVGVVALSFHPDTMQPCPSLPPPPGTAYLSNMAVDVKLRRQGIAKALLTAASAATLASGHKELYLHVKQSDAAAQKLYLGGGYEEVSKDGGFVVFKGIKPRILMRKSL